MVKIIIYDDKIAPLQQLLNNKNLLDLLPTIQTYRIKQTLPKLNYMKELKDLQNIALINNQSFVDYMWELNNGLIFFYKNLELLSLLY